MSFGRTLGKALTFVAALGASACEYPKKGPFRGPGDCNYILEEGSKAIIVEMEIWQNDIDEVMEDIDDFCINEEPDSRVDCVEAHGFENREMSIDCAGDRTSGLMQQLLFDKLSPGDAVICALGGVEYWECDVYPETSRTAGDTRNIIPGTTSEFEVFCDLNVDGTWECDVYAEESVCAST